MQINVPAGLLGLALLLSTAPLHAQKADSIRTQNDRLDSLYIHEVEEKKEPYKVLHAEPLYIDLIRDLGARKGEKEWNLGMGLTDNYTFDKYTALVEYEFAPINRLGLEVEVPFTFYYPTTNGTRTPGNKINSLKLAGQYSFYVSERYQTTMAIGYIHEFELAPFREYRTGPKWDGHLYNPFFIAAKRWGQNLHTLIYTGPQLVRHHHDRTVKTNMQINTNLHYMIDGTRNFIGVEVNKDIYKGMDMVIRPQMRVGIADNVLIGIVTGIPTKRTNERFSTFLRLIYEPRHRIGNRLVARTV